MSAAIDRACAWGILADGGPMTCEEVRRALPVLAQRAPRLADGSEAWDYGRVHNALRSLVRRGWVRAAGRGSGQAVLWYVPEAMVREALGDDP